MEQKAKKIISIAILAIIVYFFIKYILNHIADFSALKIVNPLWLIVLLCLVVISYYFIGLQMDYLIRPFGVKFTHSETFMLSIATGFYNLITPAKGGMLIRATYLKKKHNFSYTNFIVSLSGLYALTIFISSFLGIISIILIYAKYQIFNWIISAIFVGMTCVTSYIIFMSPKLKEHSQIFLNKIVTVVNGWHKVRTNSKAVAMCLFSTFMGVIISMASTIILYHVFGVSINILQALFLVCVGNLSAVVQITPGNLGISESVGVFSGLVLGISPAQSLSATLLGRVSYTLVLCALGPLCSYKLFKKKPKD